MKIFSRELKRHVTKIINYEKKEMVPLTNEKNNSCIQQNVCYIYRKTFSTNDNGIAFKKYHKVQDPVITPANIVALLIIFVT